MKSKIAVIAGILVIGSVFFSCATDKDVTETGFNVTAKDVTKAFADIRGNELEEIKINGIFICPFVESGHEYTIFVSFHTEDGYKQVVEHTINSTATGGIYMTNSPFLHWNSENNNVTLSELPIFSEDVIYYHTPDFFTYKLDVRPPLKQTADRLEMYIWENWERSITVGEFSNELTFDIYPLKNHLKEELELTDDFSALFLHIAI